MPRPDGTVALPTDTPPRNTTRINHGLVTHASLGEVPMRLYARPWSGDSSRPTVFTKVRGSDVAPNYIRPTWVVAVNTYSPISHRSHTDVMPIPAVPARPPAAPVTQRPRPYAAGYVTRWPQVAPRWPSWGEAPRARR